MSKKVDEILNRNINIGSKSLNCLCQANKEEIKRELYEALLKEKLFCTDDFITEDKIKAFFGQEPK